MADFQYLFVPTYRYSVSFVRSNKTVLSVKTLPGNTNTKYRKQPSNLFSITYLYFQKEQDTGFYFMFQQEEGPFQTNTAEIEQPIDKLAVNYKKVIHEHTDLRQKGIGQDAKSEHAMYIRNKDKYKPSFGGMA